MIDIHLKCGREVEIRAIHVDRTYYVVMEGGASVETNHFVMNHHRDFLRSVFGAAPIVPLDSSGTPMTIQDQKLPSLRYASLLVSNDTTKNGLGMGSDLVVVWFEEEFQSIEPSYLATKLGQIDWDAMARNFDW